MTTISRRPLVRGAAWAVPTVLASTTIPLYAASLCSEIVRGKPLPVSAFIPTYVADTNETLGGINNKLVALDFGFKVSTDITTGCNVSGSISSSNGSGTSYFRLSNGKTYSGSNSGSVPANGQAGVTDTSCQGGQNGTQACGTSGVSAYNLSNSTGTSSSTVTGVSIYRTVTVAGYGTTVFYINASGFTTPGSKNLATTLSITATPLYSV